MPPFVLAIVALFFSFSPYSLHAEPITGRVVGIMDGDTLDIVDAKFTKIRIRLAAIDAPEKAQPFGTRARQALAAMCFGQSAVATPTGAEHRGRVIAFIRCGGVDANRAMVAEGFAWVYRQYSKDGDLLSLEGEARRLRLGLWADASPTPPWEWRHRGQ